MSTRRFVVTASLLCTGLFLLVGGTQAAEQAAKPGKAARSGAMDDETVAARVKEIFRVRCFECHGGSSVSSGVKVLDRESLLKRKKIVPGKPDDSPLFQVIAASDESIMPPTGNPALTPEEIDLIRRWINAGAMAFPADAPAPTEKDKDPSFRDVSGVDYVMKKILGHVRETRRADRRYYRYFSINHILIAGATPAELELHRDAFAKAINHLSWERNLVKPEPIDAPHNTVFALDIRKLGWDVQPFRNLQCRVDPQTNRLSRVDVGKSSVNLYDLVLLEYPYAVLYDDSETFDHLLEEYILPSHLIRPIAYVRADWFASIITQPPLYEDMLLLPYTVQELEQKLGVDVHANLETYKARRAGMTVSGVSRSNRVVERHPLRDGAYWKSFDFRSNKGSENMFKDPLGFRESGGEMIFHLPNGLQGYYVADASGERIELAPTDIVTDKFAADKTVRNGLACMRCHDGGMKGFKDDVRPALERLPGSPGFDRRTALELYAKKQEMDDLLREDTERFLSAMEKLLGKPQKEEPLIPVSKRFLDMPLSLTTTAGELGLTEPKELINLFRAPAFSMLGLVPLAANGVIRRDAWEDYYDAVVRGLGLGMPLVPLDGLNRLDYPVGQSTIHVDLKTNRRGNVFVPGDEVVLTVTNRSEKTIYIELTATSTRGRKLILTPQIVTVRAGQSYRYPEKGGLRVRGATGKELITVLASSQPFECGQLLGGKGVTDRIVHPFYRVEMVNGRPRIRFDAATMVKRTIEIETK